MTVKRFTMYQNTIYENGNIISAFTCMKRLNALYEENEQLKQQIFELKLIVENWERLDDEKDEQLEKQNNSLKKLVAENEQLKHRLAISEKANFVTALEKENKQLKQRNENQYNQLNQLWKLIQAKDWETLTKMDNQMKEDEERLQREWKCYE